MEIDKDTVKNMTPSERRIHEEVMHRSSTRASIREKVFYRDPQSRLLDYLTELELRVQKLEKDKK